MGDSTATLFGRYRGKELSVEVSDTAYDQFKDARRWLGKKDNGELLGEVLENFEQLDRAIVEEYAFFLIWLRQAEPGVEMVRKNLYRRNRE